MQIESDTLLSWNTPRALQGQTVDVAYAWTTDGTIVRRVHDRSEGPGAEVYTFATPDDDELDKLEGWDSHGADDMPIHLDWKPCEIVSVDED